MPRNGNGEYDLPAGNPVVPGTVIESEWANNTMNDLAVALTDSLTADGQTTPVSNLPMGGYHHTGVSDPTLRNQYATLGMSQDGRNTRVQITSGVDNLIGTLVGQGNAYVAGALVSFFAPATNTGAMTLNYNGIGARSLVADNGLPLVAGQVQAGDFYMALYNGSVFVLITSVGAADSNTFQSSTSGWLRPIGGQYPALTIATASTINIPAGEGYIVPPGASGAADAIKISWLQQTVTLNFLNTSFSTTITVDQNGDIQQLPGRAVGANVRTGAILGVVQHFSGVASTIQTQPAIFGDDGYLTRGVSTLLAGSIVSGAKLTANGVAPLQMDISGGIIYQPGASNQTPDSPNTLTINAQANLNFKTLAGEATIGTSVLTNAPVNQYDPNGAGVVLSIPQNGDAVIHRLYYLLGQYIWVFGQFIYTSADAALARIEVDRTNRLTSTRLAGATLIAEIIATKATTTLNGPNGIILARGAVYFSIGSSGGIGEAPVNGLTYGRKNAAWSTVVDASTPQVTGDIEITKSGPKLIENFNPVAAGFAGLSVEQLGIDWCNIEITSPDDKTYFRSYNPSNGNLRNTTTWDLATGRWTFPEAAFVNAAGSATDTTAGRLMKVGDFGLGGGGALSTNLDTISVSGLYRAAAATGSPSGGAETTVIHVDYGASNATQLAIRTSNGACWIRTQTSGVWSGWKTVAVDAGTAAFANLTTSSTDTTAGRVTKVGDFGLGAGLQVAPADLDTLTTPGLYYASNASAVNYPSTYNSGLCAVMSGGAANVLTQTFYPTGDRTKSYFRTYFTTWGAWREVASNVGTAAFGTLTTSTTDTTVGRVARVGDYGLGGQQAVINDPDLAVGNGFYRVTNSAKMPSTSSYNVLSQVYDTSGMQMCTLAGNQNQQISYIRTKGGGTWGSWVQIALNNSTPNFGSVLENAVNPGFFTTNQTIVPTNSAYALLSPSAANLTVTFDVSQIPVNTCVTMGIPCFNMVANPVTWRTNAAEPRIYWEGGVRPTFTGTGVMTFLFVNNGGTLQAFGFASGLGMSLA